MKRSTKRLGYVGVWVSLCLLPALLAQAQLTDSSQTSPQVPGGAIGKSLQEQIGAGRGDEFTPGSSRYLIARDPARAIRRGRQLFQRKFTANQGVGPRVSGDSIGNIQTNPALGAGLADSCAACHGRPRGSAGVGGDVATRPDSRDAPHLFGLGLVEMLADEVTADLRAVRTAALTQAQLSGRPVTRLLNSKGLHYGRITVSPEGTVDTSQVEGVDPDLRVKPFFAQGKTISIREFIIGAFQDEMGLQTADPVLCEVTHPTTPQTRVSPAGFVFDPTQDTFSPPPLCNGNLDKDQDGVIQEIDPALVDHMEFYLLNYFKPGRSKIDSFVQGGLHVFERIGCTTCHVQNLTITQDRRVADVETRYDPQRGIFNKLFATATTLFTSVADGDPYPRLVPKKDRFVVRNIFTDLKRHDLGPALHERNYDGSLHTTFMTEPLWGVGSTAPYGHDGRSMDLQDIILRHGGEAEASRRAFQRLSDFEKRLVLDFLRSLVLFPPDDTASNLNPGNPSTTNPQDPAQHGSINLGALFQIPSEGAE